MIDISTPANPQQSALNARFGTVPEAVRQRVQEVREESRLCEGMRLVITEPALEQFLAKF